MGKNELAPRTPEEAAHDRACEEVESTTITTTTSHGMLALGDLSPTMLKYIMIFCTETENLQPPGRGRGRLKPLFSANKLAFQCLVKTSVFGDHSN